MQRNQTASIYLQMFDTFFKPTEISPTSVLEFPATKKVPDTKEYKNMLLQHLSFPLDIFLTSHDYELHVYRWIYNTLSNLYF